MEVETEVKVKRLVREKEEQMAEADVELELEIGHHWPVVHWHVQAGSFGWKASNVDAGS